MFLRVTVLKVSEVREGGELASGAAVASVWRAHLRCQSWLTPGSLSSLLATTCWVERIDKEKIWDLACKTDPQPFICR